MLIPQDAEKLLTKLKWCNDQKPLPVFPYTFMETLNRIHLTGVTRVYLTIEEYLELEPYIYE